MEIRKYTVAILCLLFPVKFIYRILNLLGNNVHPTAKIGFSIIWIDGKIILNSQATIGSFNFLRLQQLTMHSSSYMHNFNNINSLPIHLLLHKNAALGNKISIYCAQKPISYGNIIFEIGVFSKLTSNHKVDCTRSIYVGNYSIIAGSDTQIWTHGYYHASTGIERIRIDGEIHIGNNVYVGSRCTIMPGVRVADGVHIGANCCISKSLSKSGMYVSQPLRYIDNDINSIREKLDKVEGYDLCEEVYEKK